MAVNVPLRATSSQTTHDVIKGFKQPFNIKINGFVASLKCLNNSVLLLPIPLSRSLSGQT